jgi:hypothetical protein
VLDGAPFRMTGHKQQLPELVGVKLPQSLCCVNHVSSNIQ